MFAHRARRNSRLLHLPYPMETRERNFLSMKVNKHACFFVGERNLELDQAPPNCNRLANLNPTHLLITPPALICLPIYDRKKLQAFLSITSSPPPKQPKQGGKSYYFSYQKIDHALFNGWRSSRAQKPHQLLHISPPPLRAVLAHEVINSGV